MTMFCSYNNFLLFICNINITVKCSNLMGFPGGSAVKNLLANAGGATDSDSVLGSEIFPGGGNGKPLQSSCLENSNDRGAWRATVHGVTKSRIRLSN